MSSSYKGVCGRHSRQCMIAEKAGIPEAAEDLSLFNNGNQHLTSEKVNRAHRHAFLEDEKVCYAEKYDKKELSESLIGTSHLVQDDAAEAKYFRNLKDDMSDHHVERDRTVFKENVYFLVGEPAYSWRSSIVENNNIFTSAGQPTGGHPSHYGETLMVKLPNSGIICRNFCKKSSYPDVEIWPTFEYNRYGRDQVFTGVSEDPRNKIVPIE